MGLCLSVSGREMRRWRWEGAESPPPPTIRVPSIVAWCESARWAGLDGNSRNDAHERPRQLERPQPDQRPASGGVPRELFAGVVRPQERLDYASRTLHICLETPRQRLGNTIGGRRLVDQCQPPLCLDGCHGNSTPPSSGGADF